MQKNIKYSTDDGYDSYMYWFDRHSKYGFNFQGVGNRGLTPDENKLAYTEASKVFLSLCEELGISFPHSRVLDIGCGNGFYTNLMKDNGVVDYTGIDIVDVLFPELGKSNPDFIFKKLDVTKVKIEEKYDLIIMIDVTQHIVNNSYFEYAMNNVKKALSVNGCFIVTSWLDGGLKNLFYEKSRDFSEYENIFLDYRISEPRKFRDKFIFAVTNEGNLD